MKAEQRKELQTNVLADRMGRFVQDFKSSQQSRSIAVIVVVVVAVLTYVGWQWSMALSGRTNQMWIHLDQDALLRAGDNEPNALARRLDEIAQQAPSSLPARTARFQEARLRLSTGMSNLYGFGHKAAAIQLMDARKVYKELVEQSRGDDILMQEALMGVAQTEEALVGVADVDDPKQPAGSLDEALKNYRTLAARFPDGYLGKQAAARAARIEKDRKGIEQFYATMREQAAAKPDFGIGLPPGHP